MSSSERVRFVHALHQATRTVESLLPQLGKQDKARAYLGAEIDKSLTELRQVRDRVDEVSMPKNVIDPTNPQLIGCFIGLALLAQEAQSVKGIKPFHGSGIYALYYTGKSPIYKKIKGEVHPIYIGSSVSDDATTSAPRSQGMKIYKRILEHQKSIESISGNKLGIKNFKYRCLVMNSGWEISAEQFLINTFRPVWNKGGACFGIGKHGDKKARSNRRSPWDTLHRGRKFANPPNVINQKPPKQILKDIRAHFGKYEIYRTQKTVLNHFFNELKQ